MAGLVLLICSVLLLCQRVSSLTWLWNDTFTLNSSYDFLLDYHGQPNGQQRLYHIAYIDMGSTHSYPVIFLFHGGGGSAIGISFQAQYHIKAAPLGYLVVYAEGVGFNASSVGINNILRTWNAGFSNHILLFFCFCFSHSMSLYPCVHRFFHFLQKKKTHHYFLRNFAIFVFLLTLNR